MTSPGSPALTISKVNKAGSRIRKFLRGDPSVSPDQVQAAGLVIDSYRAEHQKPLVTANNGLRSMITTERCPVRVSQRLKRFMTILDKLEREPTLALSRMQDIGGCRAVLDSVDQIRRVEARLKSRRQVVGYSDYITAPRASGYRGVHMIVEYGGRAIEVQLRTRAMHAWAITVERQTQVVGQNLKQDGNHAVQRLMAAVSEAMALEEAGAVVSQDLLAQLDTLRLQASPYLSKGSS